MNTIDDGGPAFPVKYGLLGMGMTLRDYFAAKALQAEIAWGDSHSNPDKAAEWSYQFADAMLKERVRCD